MNIQVKKLRDEKLEMNEFVFFEQGKFSKPIMILNEFDAHRLYKMLAESFEKENDVR